MSASGTRLRIEFAQASDPGRDPNKQVNEDSCGYAESKLGHLCVLCDGMGGHYGGKEASRLAITTIFEMMDRAAPGTTPAAALKTAIEEAGRRVYRLGGPPENRTRPGSTAVAMVLHDKGVDVAHVGDSRAFVIRANQIYPLTRDHSMVQGMIDAGLLTEAQAIGHPDANKITRALGMKPEVEVEVRPEPMELFPGDILLLSSDGLTDLALSADILGATRQALASGGVESACKELVRLANDRGGHDNITVQIARVQEAPKASTTIPAAPADARSGPLPPAPVQETVPMTAVGTGAPGPVRDVHWAPPAPTATDRPAGHSPAAHSPQPPAALQLPPQSVRPLVDPAGAAGRPLVAPTISEQPPQPPSSNPTWSSGMYQPLSSYRVDGGVNALPLPPAGAATPAPTVGYGGTPAPPGPTPLMTPAPQPYSYTPAPPSVSAADARPSQAGVVFLVIGMAAVIAVLIVLLIWALAMR